MTTEQSIVLAVLIFFAVSAAINFSAWLIKRDRDREQKNKNHQE